MMENGNEEIEMKIDKEKEKKLSKKEIKVD